MVTSISMYKRRNPMGYSTVILMLVSVLAISTGCNTSLPAFRTDAARTKNSIAQPYRWTGNEWPNEASSSPTDVPIYSYDVIAARPHDRSAFTEGLVFLDGTLLESTGLNGQSTLRKVDLESGRVLKQVKLARQYFAEGLAVLGGKIFQLTWKHGRGFVYDLESFHWEKEFPYEGEGWGLTTDGQWLILCDGTPQIRFLDPMTFDVKRTITVLNHGQPIKNLNELEYVKGEIFANIWHTDYVVRIDPVTGKVLGLINFAGLLAPQDRDAKTDVLNGIAYDAAGDRLFITGKRWPKLFEVRLKLKP